MPRRPSPLKPWGLPALPPWQGLFAPVTANTFDELGVNVALWVGKSTWHAIRAVEDVTGFEYESGAISRRWDHNDRRFTEVLQTRSPLLGEHAGFHDLFVPVLDSRATYGVLVTGPFALERPRSADVLSRWRGITGKQGRVGDSGFADYLAATLATVTLRGPWFEAFRRFMGCFAGLVAHRERPEALFAEAEEARQELSDVRLAERMWEAVRAMVDERTIRGWAHHRGSSLDALGMTRLPEHVAVGLLRASREARDPVDDSIRRDGLQRACVELARQKGGVVAGQIGDHGVVFLVEHAGPRARTRSMLMELATKAATLARRFGLELHVGIHPAQSAALTLPAQYRAALSTAEQALSRGVRIAFGDSRRVAEAQPLRELRAGITDSVRQNPRLLSARFDGYIEAVLARTGHRLERARAELDAGFERITEPLLVAGVLTRRSHAELLASLEDNADSARTVVELVNAYRKHVADVQASMQNATRAGQERGTRRAVAFMQDHYADPLRIEQVARVAGFAPDYFSRLFKSDEGVTPEVYLQRLRVQRTKVMLTKTNFAIESVGKLCGLPCRNYFHRLFKRTVGMTPQQYRMRES